MRKQLRKALAFFVAMTMLCVCMPMIAGAADVNADAKVFVETFVGENTIANAFVGETVNTVVSIQDFDNLGAASIIMHYDPTVVQLVNSEGVAETTGNKVKKDIYGGNGGVSVPSTFRSAWQGADLVINDEWPYINAEKGVFFIALLNQNNAAVIDKTGMISLRFKALKAGDAGIKFAALPDGEYDESMYDSNTPNGYGFGYGNDDIHPDVSVTALTIVDAPGAPEPAQWSTEKEKTAEWTVPDTGCRGYQLTLYNAADGSDVKTEKITDASETSKDITTWVTKTGNYYFGVTALGGEGAANSDEVFSSDKENGGTYFDLSLATPDAPEYKEENGKITVSWDAVDNAKEYTVTVYDKAGNAEEFTTTELYCDVTSVIGVGDYTFTVKANQNGVYTASNESDASEVYSTGSTITGVTKVELATKNLVAIKVTLIGETVGALEPQYADLADGSFTFTGVPADTYTITLERAGAVNRTIEGLVLDASVTKAISTDSNVMYLFPGDLYDSYDGDNKIMPNVNYMDIAAIVTMINLKKGEDGYRAEADYILDEGVEGITVDEISPVVTFFSKDSSKYQAWNFN